MEGSMKSKPRMCFEVEKVIGICNDGNVRSYRVQWAPAWVSSLHLVGCEQLIKEFLHSQCEKEIEDQPENEPEIQPTVHQQKTTREIKNVKTELRTADNAQYSSSEQWETDLNSVDSSDAVVTKDNIGSVVQMLDIHQSQNFESTSELGEWDESAVLEDNFENLAEPEQSTSVSPENVEEMGELSYSGNVNVKVEIDDDEEDDLAIVYETHPESTSSIVDPSNSHQLNVSHNQLHSTTITSNNEPSSSSRQSEYSTKPINPTNYADARNNSCRVCGKHFQAENHLRIHFRIHTGLKAFACSHCPKTFNQRSNLRLHLRSHSGEKPYHCNFCGKSFSQSSTLKRHQHIHTGERPYTCEKCGRGFTHSNKCKRHAEKCEGVVEEG